jgi:pyruvate,water dikinase
MGLALYHLSRLLPPDTTTVEAVEQGLRDGTLPAAFREAWADFLVRYGHRGPRELDIAALRYRDNPRLLLQQLAQLRQQPDDSPDTPLAIYERSQRERHEAFEALDERVHAKGWLSSKRFRSLYRVVETLGGLRETPKFYLIYALDLLRQRLLDASQALTTAGRLDRPTQVFDLVLDDLDRGLADVGLDLRARAAERRAPHARVALVKQPPSVIDSRGRIFRPAPPPAREGEVVGQPVSAGVVRGPIKVLHTPDEKPLLPGEVLVAWATDPGWTPLFVNAAAVILEVGGVLQHGALVAREYGKPCVTGVDRATERFVDGTMVEVDGAAGIIRLLTPAAV